MNVVKYKKRILFVGMPDMALVCFQRLYEEGFNIVGVVPPEKTNSSYFVILILIILSKNKNSAHPNKDESLYIRGTTLVLVKTSSLDFYRNLHALNSRFVFHFN